MGPTDSGVLATADVVVVGGGISGWCTAFELRRRGFQVAVAEQRFTAYGASGRNPGSLWVQLRRTGLELDLALKGLAKYRELLDGLGTRFDFRQDGGLFFYETPAQEGAVHDYVADRRAAGLDVELLTPDKARAYSPLLPRTALGAVYCPGDAQVDSAGFVRAVSAHCVGEGVAKFENTAVLSTLRRGDTVIGVRTVRGDIHAPGVVWATGAWAGNLRSEGLDLPIGTARTGHLRIQPVGRRTGPILHGPRGVAACGAFTDLPSYREKDFPAPGGERRQVDYDDTIAHTEDGGLYVGSTVDGRGSLNPHISLTATHAMTGTVIDRFGEHASAGVVGLWAGLTCETSDHLPVVDRVDGVYLNTGHAWGVASGPVCGELAAQLIAGESGPWVDRLRMDRPTLTPSGS
jgi:glycine/D-amino acid oxidase-like deaminating enzyme